VRVSAQRRAAARAPRAPFVEIHLHLEGSISLRRLRQLLETRKGSRAADPRDWYRHRSFPEFLRHFALVTQALREPEDFALITLDLCRRLRHQGVAAAEAFFSPVIFTRRGLPFLEILDAMEEAVSSERRRGGPRIAWLLDAVRQWGPAGMEQNLECASRAGGRVLGIGLGGDETSVPAEAFASFFSAARNQGYRTVAHAGEFDGPRSVWKALEVLGAERIGHGIRAAEDPLLLERLRRSRIPLEVCPTSNLRTGVVRRWSEHPLPRLVAAGVRVTVNSDDPALFRTSLRGEFLALRQRMCLGAAATERIRREAIRASFLPAREKRRLLAAG